MGFHQAIEIRPGGHELSSHDPPNHCLTLFQNNPVLLNLALVAAPTEVAPYLLQRTIFRTLEHEIGNLRTTIVEPFTFPLGGEVFDLLWSPTHLLGDDR